MNTLGQILRGLREKKGLYLRQVAASIEMDTALLSKFERDERIPNKEQVIGFAKFYNIDKEELLLLWLSDKIVNDIQNEKFAKEALMIAYKKIGMINKKEND